MRQAGRAWRSTLRIAVVPDGERLLNKNRRSGPDCARRNPGPIPPRQATPSSRCRSPAPARPPPRRRSRCGNCSRGNRRLAMPVPQIQIFGGGAHAHGPRRRPGLHDRLHRRAAASPRRSNGRREVYARGRRAPRRSAARCTASPTKAATGRRSRPTRKALAELVGAIADAGFEPGADVAHRARHRRHAALPRRPLPPGAREAQRCRPSSCTPCCCAGSSATRSSRSRIPFAEHDAGGDARVHHGRRRSHADRGRRFLRDRRADRVKASRTAPATPCC